MKHSALLTCLLFLAITGCTSQAAAQDSQATANIEQQTLVVKSTIKSKDEKPCLSNLAKGLAGCTDGTSQQKRFVLVRSVAIPYN